MSRSSEPEMSPCSGLSLAPRIRANTRSGASAPSSARSTSATSPPVMSGRATSSWCERADLLERVRERVVPDVVEQRGGAHDAGMRRARSAASARARRAARARAARGGTRRARARSASAWRRGTREGEPELADVAQPLERPRSTSRSASGSMSDAGPHRPAGPPARRHARVPAAALRTSARSRLSRVSRREPFALRARARCVPSRAPRARPARGAWPHPAARARCLSASCAAPRCCTTSGTTRTRMRSRRSARCTTRRSRARSSRRRGGRGLRAELGDDAPTHHGADPRAQRESAAGLISGSLDLDKIEYLKRDAFMCGVNYGDIDVDRLLNSLDRRRRSRARRSRSASTRRDCRRSSRCCSPSTRCTATCTGITRCAAPRRCTSASSTARCAPARSARRRSRPTPTRACSTSSSQPRAQPLARRAARAAPVQARLRVPRRRAPPEGGEWIADDRALVVAVEDRLAREFGLAPASCSSTIPPRRRCSASTSPCFAATAACVASRPRVGGRDQPAEALGRALPQRALAARLRLPADRGIARGLTRLATLPAADVRLRLEQGRCSE